MGACASAIGRGDATRRLPGPSRKDKMRVYKRLAASVGLLAFVLASSTASADDGSRHAKTVEHVYVNDNTAGTNTIAGFVRHADGSLTPLAGSPFAAGGAGSGSIIGSQGALQVTSDGRFLPAVDAGS